MRILGFAILACAAAASTAHAQKAAGRYTVAGVCPGQQGAYRGTLTIVADGPRYALTWLIAGETFYGSAIEQDGRLAIAYTSAGQSGIMISKPTGSGWEGVWSMYQSNMACSETWAVR